MDIILNKNLNIKIDNKAIKITKEEFISKYLKYCQFQDKNSYDYYTIYNFKPNITYNELLHYMLNNIHGWIPVPWNPTNMKYNIKFDIEYVRFIEFNITSTNIPYIIVEYSGDNTSPVIIFYYFNNNEIFF